MEGKHEMKRGAARMNLRMREGRAGSRDEIGRAHV